MCAECPGLGGAARGSVRVSEQLQDAEPPLRPGELRFGERTFGAVADGYSRLQNGTNLAQAHYGPYALVLRTEPHADTYSPRNCSDTPLSLDTIGGKNQLNRCRERWCCITFATFCNHSSEIWPR